MSYSFSVFPVIGSIHVLPVNHETRFIRTFLGSPIPPMRGQERAACFYDGEGSNMVQLWIEFDSCLILWKSQDNWWHKTVRIPVSEWCSPRLQSTFFPSMAWPRSICCFLSISVVLDVAVRTWLCSPQSTIVVVVEPILNSPYCALLCEVLWLGWSIPSKDPVWPSVCSPTVCACSEFCVVLSVFLVRLRQETKGY